MKNPSNNYIDISDYCTNSGAVLSPCKQYRYVLWRRWSGLLPIIRGDNMCAFIGLNPSTADCISNDPTIRRYTSFARAWGHSGLFALNLFAYRATIPKDMLTAINPIGEENDTYIGHIITHATRIVLCWGVHGAHRGRDRAVCALLRGAGVKPYHFGKTATGQPKHPLYLRQDTQLQTWE